MSKLKIAVIIGSTRDARFAPIPAQWIFKLAQQREDLSVELVDVKTFDLPFFNEKMSNAWAPSEDARAVAWQKKIGEFDGYIVVTAEYNRSITASLKNAFDQAYVEWSRKPIAFLGYGGLGAACAIEHAHSISIELQMVPVKTSVNIGGGEYLRTVHQREPIAGIEQVLLPSAKKMLDELVWWGSATKTARESQASKT
ncbi:NAD(P)H-dependent oxidoreductase [Acidovorax sp. SUPP1855]|uniref:NADPH-dependent FMN reductase n=1 Tax=Acidovorax sp. SUPP1855 TaxID=431774 RepID=UPI0023DE5368|nr:NAD(P)H-dependent oxidoreductase [Acidovorax sp. SUPP1855]GKS84389.1 NAD(P)H-dependent oxidoreductase [Acidovorax sp. SUPP1855]